MATLRPVRLRMTLRVAAWMVLSSTSRMSAVIGMADSSTSLRVASVQPIALLSEPRVRHLSGQRAAHRSQRKNPLQNLFTCSFGTMQCPHRGIQPSFSTFVPIPLAKSGGRSLRLLKNGPALEVELGLELDQPR